MKILNLFAGYGNNTLNLDRTKFNITHIELENSRIKYLAEKFPKDQIVIQDAYKYIIEYVNDYDFIWASPPCQSHSRARIFQLSDKYINKNFKLLDFRLYELIVFLQRFANKPWIVENVIPYYECLKRPTAQLGRHKIWSNFNIRNKSFKPDYIETIKKSERDKTNPEIFPYILNQLKNKTLINFIKE